MEYSDVATYIVHGDDSVGGKEFTATDGSGDSIVIKQETNGYTINGTLLYNSTTVDNLIQNVKDWANNTFQQK